MTDYRSKILRAQADYLQGLATVKANNPHGWMVDEPNSDQLHRGDVIVTADKKAGFIVTRDKELVGVWSTGKGYMGRVCRVALSLGAERLTCYGWKLADMYTAFGFKVVAVHDFDPQLAPTEWKPEFGYPDYIEMLRA